MSRILVVDDERSMREVMEIFFLQQGHEVVTAEDGAVGIARLEEEEFDLVLTDLRMPKAHGMAVVERCRALYPETPIIVMTAYASAETAVTAWKKGAFDHFTKPFQLDAVRSIIDKALEKRRLFSENRALRAELAQQRSMGRLIGKSPAMRAVFDMIRRIAPTRTNVLVLGESGTGKELVAQALHTESPRRNRPFLVVNCGAIPENLLESELFGHRKGTFTGATENRKGMFQAAEGGTLLLDEIGELPMAMQVKLLRVLQERKVRAVGDLREVPIDVRVIAATNRDLEAEVRAGRFREDLYYRLNVISIELPPLRARVSDIPMLAQHFLRTYAADFGKTVTGIAPSAMQRLLQHPFSGNVRELANIMERAVALEDGAQITLDALPQALHKGPSPTLICNHPEQTLPAEGVRLDELVANMERRLIKQALERTGGRKKNAAALLGITFRSFRYRLAKLCPDLDAGPS